MSYKLHKRALGKHYTEVRRYNNAVSFTTYVDDNDHDGLGLSIASNVMDCSLTDLDIDERTMFNMLTHYIHEAGEHIVFDSGKTFNQHSPEGSRNMARILRRVMAHLESVENLNA